MRGWPRQDPGNVHFDDGREVPGPRIGKAGKAPLPRTALSLSEGMKGLVACVVM